MKIACLLLLALPGCAAGTLQDAAHSGGVPLTAGLTAGAATMNPLIGGGTALATWLAELLIPDGEDARDQLQDEEAIAQLIEILKARGMVTQAEVDAAQGESEGLFDRLESLLFTIVGWAIGLVAAYLIGGLVYRRWIKKKDVGVLESFRADLDAANETIRELKGDG